MADSFGPDNLPDEEVSKKASSDSGFSSPGDFGDLPVSPVGNKSSGNQKSRMGYNADSLPGNDKIPGGYGNLANAASGEGSASDKAQEAGRQALKSAASGGEGGLPGGKGLPGGSGPITKGDKEAEAKKGNTEKNVDAAAVAAASYFGTPAAGAAVEKLGGVRGIAKKAGIISLIALVPFILFGFFIAYIISNPWEALQHVLLDKKTREFTLNVADNWSQNNGMLNAAVKAAKAANSFTINPDGSHVVAANQPTKPEPGSIEEKLEKIDWSKSQFQTLPKDDCRYDLELQQVIGSDGKPRSIPKSVVDKQTGQKTPVDQLNGNTEAGYCVAQKYPIFNLMWRQPMARDLNHKADLYLSYAAAKDAKEVNGSTTEVDKYVYDKTLKRITSEPKTGVDLTTYKPLLDQIAQQYAYNVSVYNQQHPSDPVPPPDPAKQDIVNNLPKMYQAMAEGTSPYSQEMSVNKYFNIPNMETPKYNDAISTDVAGTGIAQAICPLIYSFADVGLGTFDAEAGAKNARAAIESRLTGAERGSAKSLTLTDTRKANALNTNESNATIQQNDNWASSTAYQIDVYNQLRGVQMNPEGTHNRAYNVQQQLFYSNDVDPNSPLHRIRGACYVIGVRGGIIQGGPEKDQPVDADRGHKANADMVVAFQDLKKQILAQSPGTFNSPQDFGIEQVMTGYIRTGSITAVSGLEPGPDNYNRQSMGVRQLINDYNLGIGARFLSDTEAKDLAIRADNIDRLQQKNNGIAYRLFNTANIHSLASTILQNMTSPNTAKTAMIGNFKSILSPLYSLASIHSNLSFYLTGIQNRAFAADITGDQYFKIDTSGFTPQELALDPIDNAHIIEAIKKGNDENTKRTLSHYDECFKAKIPSTLYFEVSEVEIRDDKNNLTGYKRYFTYYPDKSIDLNTSKQVVNDSPDSEFNKFMDCKFLLEDAKDLNNPSQLLAIRYRLYTYYNTQLDYLGKLSSDASDTSIYAGSSGGGGSLENNGQTSANFIWPVEEPYGISRCTKGHGFPAVDIYFSGKETAKIYAVADGEVAAIRPEGQSGGYGNFVILKHDNGLYTAYAHNKEILVQNVGDKVKQGDVISIGDSTGQSTGPHLHFEVRKDGVDGAKQNPGDYLPDKANIKSICSQ